VPIRASAARQIETLIIDLGSERTDVREAAIARLTLVGARAVERLILMVDAAVPVATRVAVLRTLEAIADPRALDPVLGAVDAPEPAVAAAAATAARVFLRGPRGALTVDRLARVATDSSRDDTVRVAAIRTLGDLDAATVAPLLEALGEDASEPVRTATRLSATRDPAEVISRAAERGLPDDSADLAQALPRAGTRVPLPVLLQLIERVREREAAEAGIRRDEWTRVRGSAHVALAERGSRIALFDLRESIEAARLPLPVEFLSALSSVGDASCLEPIAAAYAGAVSGEGKLNQNRWWIDHLAGAFAVIVRRERLTRRHALVRKIEKRWGASLEALWRVASGKADPAREH
jgi:HEAT repeat protein